MKKVNKQLDGVRAGVRLDVPRGIWMHFEVRAI